VLRQSAYNITVRVTSVCATHDFLSLNFAPSGAHRAASRHQEHALPAASAPYATAPGLPSSRQREKLRLALDGSERMLDLILSGVPARRVRWSARATAGVIIEKRDSRGGIQAHWSARGETGGPDRHRLPATACLRTARYPAFACAATGKSH